MNKLHYRTDISQTKHKGMHEHYKRQIGHRSHSYCVICVYITCTTGNIHRYAVPDFDCPSETAA